MKIFIVVMGVAGVMMATAAVWARAPQEPAAPGAGEAFYENEVLPRLGENGCATCHGQHYIRPRVLEYRELLPYLGMGTGPTQNVLIVKMANLRSIRPDRPSHPGGQRCKDINAEPCATFQKWWTIEFANGVWKK